MGAICSSPAGSVREPLVSKPQTAADGTTSAVSPAPIAPKDGPIVACSPRMSRRDELSPRVPVAGQGETMNEQAAGPASEFLQLSVEELEKQFITQRLEAMGDTNVGSSYTLSPLASKTSSSSSLSSQKSPRTPSRRQSVSVGNMSSARAKELERFEEKKATVFSVLNKATVGDLGGMHQPNELVFTRMSSGGKGPHPQRVLSLEVVEEDDESASRKHSIASAKDSIPKSLEAEVSVDSKPSGRSSPTGDMNIAGLRRNHSTDELELLEVLQKAQLSGNVVVTSQHPVLPYQQGEDKDTFQRGRTVKKNGRLSSSHGQALDPSMHGIDEDGSEGELRTPSPPARTASEAYGASQRARRAETMNQAHSDAVASRSRAADLLVQGKIFTDSISKADRSGPHERTPSDWENEFLAQQTAAFSDDTANPISHDTTGKERTPSEWESEFLAQQTAAFSDETANPINDDTTGKCTDDGPAMMSAAEGQNAASKTLAMARINSVGAPAISVDAAMNLLQQSSAGDPK